MIIWNFSSIKYEELFGIKNENIKNKDNNILYAFIIFESFLFVVNGIIFWFSL